MLRTELCVMAFVFTFIFGTGAFTMYEVSGISFWVVVRGVAALSFAIVFIRLVREPV